MKDYSHDHDHTARNVAIVLGSLGGLLLVIILLSFVKRTCKLALPFLSFLAF